MTSLDDSDGQALPGDECEELWAAFWEHRERPAGLAALKPARGAVDFQRTFWEIWEMPYDDLKAWIAGDKPTRSYRFSIGRVVLDQLAEYERLAGQPMRYSLAPVAALLTFGPIFRNQHWKLDPLWRELLARDAGKRGASRLLTVGDILRRKDRAKDAKPDLAFGEREFLFHYIERRVAAGVTREQISEELGYTETSPLYRLLARLEDLHPGWRRPQRMQR